MREQIEALLNEMIAAHSTPQRQELAAKILRLVSPPAVMVNVAMLEKDPAFMEALAKLPTAQMVGSGRVDLIDAPWQPVEIVKPGEGHPEAAAPLPMMTIGSTDEPGHAFEVKNFPCGVSASGSAPLPDVCPVHQDNPELCIPGAK